VFLLLIGKKTGNCILYSIKKGNNEYQPITTQFEIEVRKIIQPNITIQNINDNKSFILHDVITEYSMRSTIKPNQDA
jgi:hypothetical protein